jgi:hypothetical protein
MFIPDGRFLLGTGTEKPVYCGLCNKRFQRYYKLFEACLFQHLHSKHLDTV